MHFCIKCICNILFCKNAFLHQQNVRIKCIFAQLNIFQRKMLRQNAFCRYFLQAASNAFVTFCFAKMHFCTNKMYASNAFLHQMQNAVEERRQLGHQHSTLDAWKTRGQRRASISEPNDDHRAYLLREEWHRRNIVLLERCFH